MKLKVIAKVFGSLIPVIIDYSVVAEPPFPIN